MPEKSTDSTIKLFGKTIPLSEKASKPVVPIANVFADDDDNINNCKVHHPSYYTNSLLEGKDIIADKLMKSEQEVEDPKEADNEDRSETSNPEEKTLKSNKVLPCPRCDSLDTKFCYYNNYNVSQPRHFCKNCQRYWTAGGTMRNVPVGAGRRKTKHSSSHSRRLIVSEPLQNGVEHRSSVSSSNNDVGSQDQTMKNFQSFPPHVPCFPGFFLPCSWNSTRWSSRIPPPTFCPPMPFYPAAPYWATWNVPWLTQPSPSSASNSPLLGKHSRDENLSKPSNDDERCPWVPKTLRLDDLGEVSRSSISGSKNDKSESVGNRRQVLETSQILQVNPAAAALSR